METNQRVSDAYSSMQMPKMENKNIVIDDYSTWGCALSRRQASDLLSYPAVRCVAALTMQILKPAGFVDTAHYPLLLLV